MVVDNEREPLFCDPEESSLSERIENQDKRAFEVLVEKYYRRVYRQAYLILQSVREAEDATQEVFLKAYYGMSNYKAKSLPAWLGAITHNHCVDLIRKRKKEVPTIRDPHENLFSTGSKEENLGILDEALGKLSEIEREVIVLRVIEHLEYPEIAEITGMIEGSIRNIVCRSLRKLREEIERNGAQ